MIGTTFDQIQKLFGRGFLLAALVPSFLFIIVTIYLLWGFDVLQHIVQDWTTQKDWQVTFFQALLALLTVYLLAYILYGLRAAILEIYKGQLLFRPILLVLRPKPLRVLSPLSWEQAAMRRYQRRDKEKREAVDDIGRDTEWLRPFKQVGALPSNNSAKQRHALRPPNPKQTAKDEKKLAKAQAHFNKLYQRLKPNQQWTGRQKRKFVLQYSELVRTVRTLEANHEQSPEEFRTKIHELGNNLKNIYQDSNNTRLDKAIDDFYLHEDAEARSEALDAFIGLKGNFPGEEYWLSPTRLGNVMGALESHTRDRYGISLSALWPRLIYELSADARSSVEEAKIYLDFTILMSFVSFLASVTAVVGVFHDASRGLLLQLILVLACLASWQFFYHLGIQAARAYGMQAHATVDLFRLKVLDALEIERPKNPAEEKEIWTGIARFLVQAIPLAEPVQFRVDKTQVQSANNSVASTQPDPTQMSPADL